jgi:hypothetical protein
MAELGPLRAGLQRYHEKRISQGNGNQRPSCPGDEVPPVRGSPSHGRSLPMQQRIPESPDITWSNLCAEARAEADRKRGLFLRVRDATELQRWLVTDISQQASLSAEIRGVQYPPSESIRVGERLSMLRPE